MAKIQTLPDVYEKIICSMLTQTLRVFSLYLNKNSHLLTSGVETGN